jgi:hypothetical protein
MGLFAIFDDAFACGEAINYDREGAETYALIVKCSFTWDPAGRAHAIAPQAVVDADVYDGKPGRSAVVFEAELAPRKTRVDVLLAGEIALASPVERAVVRLEVGGQIRKTAFVFGDRVWVPGAFSGLRPSAPRPFARMPITWSRSFGGVDPESPAHLEKRNPVGIGYARDEVGATGKPVPNFESPDAPLSSAKDRPMPIGFGPIGRWWPSRVRWAGTYDQAWLDEHFPFLPPDFDDRYFNCAPDDQQLDAYRPGEMVRVQGMTPEGDSRFFLPPVAVPVTVLERGGRATEATVIPDTVIVEPGARRFSLVGRYVHFPRPNVLSIEDVLVGEPWKGWLRARHARKRYFGRRPGRST